VSRAELEARRAELVLRLRAIQAEEPPDGCKMMPFLRWLGRRSEVDCDIRRISDALRE